MTSVEPWQCFHFWISDSNTSGFVTKLWYVVIPYSSVLGLVNGKNNSRDQNFPDSWNSSSCLLEVVEFLILGGRSLSFGNANKFYVYTMKRFRETCSKKFHDVIVSCNMAAETL